MNPYRTAPAPDAPDADEPVEPIKPKWRNPYAPDPTVRPRPWNGRTPEVRFADQRIGGPTWWLLRLAEELER